MGVRPRTAPPLCIPGRHCAPRELQRWLRTVLTMFRGNQVRVPCGVCCTCCVAELSLRSICCNNRNHEIAATGKACKACLDGFFIGLQTLAQLVRYPREKPVKCHIAPLDPRPRRGTYSRGKFAWLRRYAPCC